MGDCFFALTWGTGWNDLQNHSTCFFPASSCSVGLTTQLGNYDLEMTQLLDVFKIGSQKVP